MSAADSDGVMEYLRKIDAPVFFDRLIAKLLVKQPEDPLVFFQQAVQDIQDGKDNPSLDGEYKPKLASDTDYIRKHGVPALVNEWLEALVTERPAEPVPFHVKWLNEKKAKAAPPAPSSVPAAPAAPAA